MLSARARFKQRGGECSPKPDNQSATAQLIGLSPISSVGCALDWQVGGRGFKPTYVRTVPFPEYITTLAKLWLGLHPERSDAL